MILKTLEPELGTKLSTAIVESPSIDSTIRGVAKEILDVEDSLIELFQKPNFKGRNLTIRGTKDSSLPSYKKVRIDGHSFTDEVSSVRFHLPKRTAYALYRDDNFRGRVFVLNGTGNEEEIDDLGSKNFDNKISSSRYIKYTQDDTLKNITSRW